MKVQYISNIHSDHAAGSMNFLDELKKSITPRDCVAVVARNCEEESDAYNYDFCFTVNGYSAGLKFSSHKKKPSVSFRNIFYRAYLNKVNIEKKDFNEVWDRAFDTYFEDEKKYFALFTSGLL